MAYTQAAMLTNIIFSSIFAFFGTIGNIFVIIAFFSVRSLRTINNIFVLQLAFVDLMKASIILTTKSANQATDATSMNSGFCQISGMMRTIGSCQSAVLLAAIAVVRYFKVVRPRSFERIFTLKKTLIYCGCIFGGTFLLALLPVIGLGRYRYSKSHGACFVNWDSINLVFRSIYYLFNVGLTFPILIFCYYNIFKKLRDHSRSITPRIMRKGKSTITSPKIAVTSPKIAASKAKPDDVKLENIDGDAESITRDNGVAEGRDEEDRVEGQKVRVKGHKNGIKDQNSGVKGQKSGETHLTVGSSIEKRNARLGVPDGNHKSLRSRTETEKTYRVKIKKAATWFRMKRERSDVELEVTRVMFAIVVAYIICWMPAAFVNILNLSKVVAIPGDVLLLIVTLVDFKVCANPMIYGIGSKQFRNAFLTVLLRRREQDTTSMSGAGNSSSKYASDSPGKSLPESNTTESFNSTAEAAYV